MYGRGLLSDCAASRMWDTVEHETVCGKADEAINFWTSVFRTAKVDHVLHYGKGDEPDTEGAVKYAAFSLLGEEFGAKDSAHKHPFAFNEAFTYCELRTQEEIDYYWGKLSAESEGGTMRLAQRQVRPLMVKSCLPA